MMKYLKTLLFFCIALQSCIQNDIIDDRVDEDFKITNPIEMLTINTTYQYTTKYTDNVGQPQDIDITWTSSNTEVATISATGELKALTKGTTTIKATVTSGEGKTLTTTNTVTTTEEEVDNSTIKEKTGTIKTTSSYPLTGTFTLKEIENSEDLELIINSDYNADTSLPGLYLYMTNNPNTVAGALEVGKVTVFNGGHKYIIKNTGINDFSHLLYWCKPFGVKVGEAVIE